MLLTVTEFIGRFHPVLVHLPIGILLIGILLQWLSAYPKYNVSEPVIKIVLLIGTFSAILSCITGFLLSGSGDYDDDLVSWHMWMGIGVAAASLLFMQRILVKKNDMVTKATSISLLMLIILTGHLGGSLTHGSDYLTASLEPISDTLPKRKPIANIQEANVYNDVIQPVLQTKCYSCHSARRQKGGLRMDDPQLLMKGGKDGEIILAGKSDQSEMVKRLLLPREDEHHMPPKAKPQVNERELALIHWWIDQGADFTKKVKDLPQPEKLKPVLLALQSNHLQPKAPATVPAASVEKGDENAIRALREAGVVVVPVAQESNYLQANFVTAPNLTDEQVNLLLPLKKQLVWLKLSDTKISDKALATISGCTNLTLLYLNNTAITDKGLALLNGLHNLQVLSLVGTKVTAAGVSQLDSLKKLQSLYLYGTGIGKEDTALLRKRFSKALIDIGGYSIPFLESDTTRLSKPQVK
ncbi:c-type cytochrome domain-containing protein [Flavisolibacter nicotianae]|uniref:c-type cytochrome domain-containing protein n=1 Tax=Flavisolibacter nicotianae TaxID=2364882 RepID=UPI000EB2DB6B|nr:c-type cytochrome domain-containing protein [Flavisolibacter nicotianae]